MYILRTIPNIAHHVGRLGECWSSLQLQEDRHQNEIFRKILALPIRLRGLGIRDPTKQAPIEYEASTKIFSPIVDNIMGVGKREYDYDCECAQIRISDEIKADRQKRDTNQWDNY